MSEDDDNTVVRGNFSTVPPFTGSISGGGSGGGGGDDGSGSMDNELIDAKLDVVKSETREMVTKLEADITRLEFKMPTKTTIWAAVGTALGVGLAILAISGDRFDGGLSASPLLERYRQETISRFDEIDTKIVEVSDRTDTKLKGIENLLLTIVPPDEENDEVN